MKDYKKRAQGGYCAGKDHKRYSIKSERVFLKKELANMPLQSSTDEKLILNQEIEEDIYDRESFKALALENPELIKDPLVFKCKKRKKVKQSQKDILNKINHLEKRMSELSSECYGYERRKIHYGLEIKKLKEVLRKFQVAKKQ